MSGVDDTCGTCGRSDPPSKGGKKSKKANKKQTVEWIHCDGCSTWLHTVCANINQVFMPEIQKYWFFCEKCSPKGNLILKAAPNAAAPNTDLSSLEKEIRDLTTKLQHLQEELNTIQANSKKQLHRLQNQVREISRAEARHVNNNKMLDGIEQKLEVIESGAKLAGTKFPFNKVRM